MTEFEEDLKNKIDSEQIPMYITQDRCSMTRKTYIETNWILDTYKNWRSDEHVQNLVELGGSYVLANQNLMEENKRLTQEIVDLKSELDKKELLVVPEYVAEWYESHGESSESLEFYIYLFCGKFYSSRDSRKNRELTNFEKWFGEDKNKPIETLIRMQDGYTVEKQKFYLKNKLTNMYLYKKPLGGYGEEPTDSIKHLTDDFKFTQKEIYGMNVQGYDKEDEYKGE